MSSLFQGYCDFNGRVRVAQPGAIGAFHRGMGVQSSIPAKVTAVYRDAVINGADASEIINSLMSQRSFGARLQTSIIPEVHKGDGTPTYTRASPADQIDFEGLHHQVLSGEVRFQGSRRVRNSATRSDVLTAVAGWTLSNATSVVGATDPEGGATAYTFTATGADGAIFRDTGLGVTTGTQSWYIKRISGSGVVDILGMTGGNEVPVTVTTAWQRFSDTTTTAGGGASYVGVRAKTSGDVIAIWHPQGEDVIGQTIQTASEYVPALATANPDSNAIGVRYFSTLNGNTVVSNVVTESTGAPINSSTSKFAVLPGVSGSYFSTPNAAANQTTGDIDIRLVINNVNWSGSGSFLTKDDAVNSRSYAYFLNAGQYRLDTSVDGTNMSSPVASASPSTVFASGTDAYLRTTRSAASGDVKYYTSIDRGVNWVQLGTTRPSTAGNLFNSTAELGVGDRSVSPFPVAGNIKRLQIYNGINGTLAVDFNPNKFTTAQTATMDTGEVFTANGGARVFGSTDATYGIPAQWNEKGPLGDIPEGAATQLVTPTADISDLTQVTWVKVTTTTAVTSTGPNGIANSATRLTASGANATTLHVLVAAASSRTVSAWVRRVTGTGTIKLVQSASKSVDLASQLNSSTYTLVQFNANTDVTVAGYGFEIGTSGDAIDVWNVQFEAGAIATSPMASAGAARNADVLTYPLAGNASNTVGTAYAEVSVNGNTGANMVVIGDINGYAMYLATAGTKFSIFDGTTIGAFGAAQSFPTGLVKVATSWDVSTSLEGGSSAGSAVTTAAFDGNMNLTQIALGSNSVGVQLNGTVRFIDIWDFVISPSDMQILTSDPATWVYPNNGINFDRDGRLCLSQSNIIAAIAPGGVAVDQYGNVCYIDDVPDVIHQGVGLKTDGRLAINLGAPPPVLHGFSNGFDLSGYA